MIGLYKKTNICSYTNLTSKVLLCNLKLPAVKVFIEIFLFFSVFAFFKYVFAALSSAPVYHSGDCAVEAGLAYQVFKGEVHAVSPVIARDGRNVYPFLVRVFEP